MTKNDAERQKKFYDAVGQYVTPQFKDWLIEQGFFVKPAAIKYHGNSQAVYLTILMR